MKRWAPVILLELAAVLFLLIMPAGDGVGTRGVFLQMAPQMLWVQSLFVLWLIKYRQDVAAVKYSWFCLMFVLAIIRMVGLWHAEILAMDPRLGGRLIFVIVVIDVVLGYYVPWTRSDGGGESRSELPRQKTGDR